MKIFFCKVRPWRGATGRIQVLADAQTGNRIVLEVDESGLSGLRGARLRVNRNQGMS